MVKQFGDSHIKIGKTTEITFNILFEKIKPALIAYYKEKSKS